MRKILTFFVFIMLCNYGFAQEKQRIKRSKVDTSKSVWKKGLQFSSFAGQAGSKNWASGSDLFSLSINGFVSAFANRIKGRWYFNNSLSASYGLINSDEFVTIKNDDKIDLFSTLGANLKKHPKFGLGAAFNFRSQFSNGYNRNYLNQGMKRRTSGFFAPAYITLAPIGVNYHHKGLDIYAAPIAFRGVIVSNNSYSYAFQGGVIPAELINEKNPATNEKSVAEMYGVDPEKTISYQVGPYISIAYNKEIIKNVTYSGRVDMLSDFNHGSPENIDFFWSNSFLLKVNSWLNAVYSIDLAYDDDIKKFGYQKNNAALQTKSILGLGVSANLGDKAHRKNHKKRVYFN